MFNAQKYKSQKLGMNYQTARYKLNRMLLFKMAGELGRLNCYRCKELIESLDEFSIEHEKAWMQSDNPLETFFDLDHISFSHLHCNTKAGVETLKERRKPIKHGTYNAYTKGGCRCQKCKDSNAKNARVYRMKKWGTTSSKPPKGK